MERWSHFLTLWPWRSPCSSPKLCFITFHLVLIIHVLWSIFSIRDQISLSLVQGTCLCYLHIFNLLRPFQTSQGCLKEDPSHLGYSPLGSLFEHVAFHPTALMTLKKNCPWWRSTSLLWPGRSLWLPHPLSWPSYYQPIRYSLVPAIIMIFLPWDICTCYFLCLRCYSP